MRLPCSLMAELHRQFEAAGGTTALHSRVEGGSVGAPLQRLCVRDANSGDQVDLCVSAVVNAAGLHAQVMASVRAGCRSSLPQQGPLNSTQHCAHRPRPFHQPLAPTMPHTPRRPWQPASTACRLQPSHRCTWPRAATSAWRLAPWILSWCLLVLVQRAGHPTAQGPPPARRLSATWCTLCLTRAPLGWART
jgi:hypothetical protein